MTDNVFNAAPSVDDNRPNLEEVTVDTLVGDGRKYADQNQLAKAYVSADHTIAQRNAKIAELEAEVRIREDLMNKANNNNAANPNPNPNPEPKVNTDPAAPRVEDSGKQADVDLSALVREELKKTNEEEKFKRNIEHTANKLTDHYGSPEKANEAVRRRAEELNVGVEWLRDSAAQSPEAFFATMGINNAHSSNSPSSTGNVQIRPNANSNKKDYKYWETFRKEVGPTKFYSREVQNEMFAAARELGPSFYT